MDITTSELCPNSNFIPVGCNSLVFECEKEKMPMNSQPLDSLLTWNADQPDIKSCSLDIIAQMKDDEFSELSQFGPDLHNTCSHILDILKSDMSSDNETVLMSGPNETCRASPQNSTLTMENGESYGDNPAEMKLSSNDVPNILYKTRSLDNVMLSARTAMHDDQPKVDMLTADPKSMLFDLEDISLDINCDDLHVDMLKDPDEDTYTTGANLQDDMPTAAYCDNMDIHHGGIAYEQNIPNDTLTTTSNDNVLNVVSPVKPGSVDGMLAAKLAGDTIYPCPADMCGNLVRLDAQAPFGYSENSIAMKSGVFIQGDKELDVSNVEDSENIENDDTLTTVIYDYSVKGDIYKSDSVDMCVDNPQDQTLTHEANVLSGVRSRENTESIAPRIIEEKTREEPSTNRDHQVALQLDQARSETSCITEQMHRSTCVEKGSISSQFQGSTIPSSHVGVIVPHDAACSQSPKFSPCPVLSPVYARSGQDHQLTSNNESVITSPSCPVLSPVYARSGQDHQLILTSESVITSPRGLESRDTASSSSSSSSNSSPSTYSDESAECSSMTNSDLACSLIGLTKIRISKGYLSSPFRLDTELNSQWMPCAQPVPDTKSCSTDRKSPFRRGQYVQRAPGKCIKYVSSSSCSDGSDSPSHGYYSHSNTHPKEYLSESDGLHSPDSEPSDQRQPSWVISRSDNLTFKLVKLPQSVCDSSKNMQLVQQGAAEQYSHNWVLPVACVSDDDEPQSFRTPRQKRSITEPIGSWKVERSGDCKLTFSSSKKCSMFSPVEAKHKNAKRRTLFH